MRLSRSGDGARLQMGAVEVQTLADLLTELVDDLTADPGTAGTNGTTGTNGTAGTSGSAAPADPVHARLFPAAYADAEAERGFREMTESGLRTERVERAQRCLSELAGAPSRVAGLARRPRQELLLGDEDCDRWMRVLNDLRLVIGTRLEITEDEDFASVDPEDPQSFSYVVYGWLTAMQDNLVRIRMG
jgi:hypothetical protein